MNKFNDGSIEYLKDKEYLDKLYMLDPNTGELTYYFSTRYDLYAPSTTMTREYYDKYVEPPASPGRDGFWHNDVFYQSYREILASEEMSEKEIAASVAEYIRALWVHVHGTASYEGKNIN